jgi:starch phosphorylase
MTHTDSFQPESPLAIAAGLQRDWLDNLFYHQAKIPTNATTFDWYMALAFAIRDRLLQRWLSTRETYLHSASKLVCYLSAEFLIGPQLGQNLLNLGLEQAAERAAQDLGLNLAAIRAAEPEPGLGNGGLGRLAACYLDSLSTLEVPAIGYGIRYEFGIFEQYICDGWQREVTDKWLQFGNPWEVPRPELAVEVKLGGRTEHWSDPDGRFGVRWVTDTIVKGVPYDIPILGYRVNTANTLRLWKAEAHQTFDFQAFNQGDYYGAVDQKITSENITKVLYPNDATLAGKRLRLEQQYFFVSCALQDLLNRHQRLGLEIDTLADHHGQLRLHQPHPAARSPGDLAAADLPAGAAPAPGDHLRDQPPLPRPGADELPRRSGAAGADVADR